MPKIMLNDTEYSGVPLECVTAWPPTSDPVQVALPTMGDSNISDIGDGTVTGAIAQNAEDITELNNDLTSIGNSQVISIPFAVPAKGIIKVNIRCKVQGRAYIMTSGLLSNLVDGYNVASGYVGGVLFCRGGERVTIKETSNVLDYTLEYIRLGA